MGAVTAAVIGGAAALGGAKMAGDTAKAGRDQAGNLNAQAMATLNAVDLPSIKEQHAALEELKITGEYTPEMAETLDMTPSQMEQVAANPEVIEQQQDALVKMAEVAEGGYSEGDKAGMRQVKNEVNQNARARQKSILNEMAQRGTLGSGMELAAQLKGEQQSINAEAEASNNAIQQAQARSLQAMSQQGAMASKLRSQDVGEQTDIARAKDSINKFNTANRQRNMLANTSERNMAQQRNLREQQRVSDSNTNMKNQEELRRKGLIQQDFQNRIQKAGGQATQLRSDANTAISNANIQAGRQAGIASAIGNIAGTVGSSFSSDTSDKVKPDTYAWNQTELDPTKMNA